MRTTRNLSCPSIVTTPSVRRPLRLPVGARTRRTIQGPTRQTWRRLGLSTGTSPGMAIMVRGMEMVMVMVLVVVMVMVMVHGTGVTLVSVMPTGTGTFMTWTRRLRPSSIPALSTTAPCLRSRHRNHLDFPTPPPRPPRCRPPTLYPRGWTASTTPPCQHPTHTRGHRKCRRQASPLPLVANSTT